MSFLFFPALSFLFFGCLICFAFCLIRLMLFLFVFRFSCAFIFLGMFLFAAQSRPGPTSTQPNSLHRYQARSTETSKLRQCAGGPGEAEFVAVAPASNQAKPAKDEARARRPETRPLVNRMNRSGKISPEMSPEIVCNFRTETPK